jgi:RNA polymerase sigma factor for flagellar operon FliA
MARPLRKDIASEAIAGEGEPAEGWAEEIEAGEGEAAEERQPSAPRARGRAWKPEEWQAYRTADAETREAMVLRYLPLVKHIASRLSIGLPAHIDLDELYSYGIFGLLDAMEKFDPSRGVKFETYAFTRIRGAIVDGLRAMDWVPASLRQRARQVEEAFWSLESRLGRPANDQEVAKHLGMTPGSFDDLLKDLERATLLSLDEVWMAEGEEGEFTLRDLVGDETAPDPLENAQLKDRERMLAEAIERLPEKERLVVSLFYHDGLAPKEIAAVMNLSVSRISQLHSKAILRLRGRLARLKNALS